MAESPEERNPWSSFRPEREERPRANVFLRVMLVLIFIAIGAAAGALVGAMVPYNVERGGYRRRAVEVALADTAKKANQRMLAGAIIGGLIPPLWLIKVWRGARD